MKLSQLVLKDECKREMPTLVGLTILGIFLFLRPITVAFHHIGNISILDLYGITISYLIILGLLLNIKQIRLDSTSLLIILFSFYCLMSFFWGSDYRDVVRMIFPFLPFFLTKAVVCDKKSSIFILEILTWGYLVSICGSIAMILLGVSETVITGSMVERQSGLSAGVHTQGHLMLFFSFSFALYCLLEKEKRYMKLIMFLLFFGSLFCILKTYTRTVFLGGIIFWFSYLFWRNRRLFLCLLILSLVIIFFKFNDVKKIVIQEEAISSSSERFDINDVSSGRIWLWKHNLELFAELPLTKKLLGVGLGNELKRFPGTISRMWAGSHNDYLSLTIMTGIIGLLLYLMIYGSVFFLFLSAPLSKEIRLFGICVFISVIVMNFVSNSYIVRFQMAQLLWFLIGLICAQGKIESRLHQAENVAKPERI